MVERTQLGARQIVFPGSDNNTPLQVVRWTEQRVEITVTGVSARATIPNNAALVELASTEHCYINFGDNTVDATTTIANDGSRLYLIGVQLIPVPIDLATDEPYTHIAAIRLDTSGILQIEECG